MKLKLAAALTAILLVCACVGQTNAYVTKIGGTDVVFRANLDKAKDVVVSPDEQALKSLLLNEEVATVYVAYMPIESNGVYSVGGYELAYKIVLINKALYNSYPKVEPIALNSTDEAYAMASPTRPLILMKAYADRTAVTIDGNVILVDGKDMTQNGRDYTDLDLAIDKLLITLLQV